ncbi:MAG: SDR family NAD(P)-dependent oxidoreductase, partial [Cutibacterium sp.]|nr:SDR family NAD(P)-dependent oxidoreductase [Cutibacterium sp.]
MTGLLAGRTALVTGGTAGIGRGIAEVLALHGARVAVTGVTEERCAQAREDGLDVYQLDVRDKKACIRVVNDVATECGGLSVLIANAGVYPQVRLAHLDDDRIDFIFDVNVKGMMHVVQAATPALRESGRGRIVVTSSIT